MNVLDIKEKVNEVLKVSGSRIKENVINQLVNDELQTRSKLIIAVMGKREELEKQLKKIKPQPQFFDSEGKPMENSIGFTAQQSTDRKKLLDKLAKIDAAYQKAFADNSDWEPMKNIANGNDQGTKTEDKTE